MKKFIKVLSNPIVCVVLGALVGMFCPKLVDVLKPISNIFKSVLEVIVIPLLVCVVTESSYKMLDCKFKTVLKKFFLAVLLFTLVAIILPTVFSLSFKNLITPDDDAKILISKMGENRSNTSHISDKFSEIRLHGENPKNEKNRIDISTIILDFVPKNIFEALANSYIFQIILFFSVFGVLLNYIDKKHSILILNLINGVYGTVKIFIKIINKFMPFYLFIIISEVFSKSEIIAVLSSAAGFLFLLFLTGLFIIVFSGIVIKIRTGKGFLQQFKCSESTILISFTTRKRSEAMPYAITETCDNIGLDDEITKIGFPLAYVLAPINQIFQTILTSFFAMFLYGKQLNFETIVAIIILSFAYAYSVMGVSSAISADMLKIIFSPLGIPHDLMSAMYLGISRIWNGFSTVIAMHTDIAIISLIAPKLNSTEKNKT